MIKPGKLLLLVLLAAAIVAWFALGLGQYLDLQLLKQGQQELAEHAAQHPLRAVAIYFAIYVLVTALSLPGATVVTLAGGALFGLAAGTVIVSFASSIGATLAFLVSRHLLRDWVANRFPRQMEAVNAGFERDGVPYLLTLRLLPIFPFFIVNLMMGLTRMRVWTYYWVSQLGMLAGTLVYVNAGTQLGRITRLQDVLSPPLLASFALLALFPWLAARAIEAVRHRQLYRKWRKPASFDRNLVVIGAGSGGLVTAYIAATVKAGVTLIEGKRMGGDCLNTGCVPSKTLIRTARLMRDARNSAALGIAGMHPEFQFSDLMARIANVVAAIEPHDSVERYTRLGVDVIEGHARIVTPWEVEVNGQRITTRSIVIAAGARPLVPPIPGLEETGYVTSETLWSLRELPRRLLVLGGGPVGCELAQAFANLGSTVTLVQRGPRILARDDAEAAQRIGDALAADGVRILTGHEAVRCERDGMLKRLVVKAAGTETREQSIEFDLLLCAVGRVARTEGYGLEQLGIALTARKSIETNQFMQTRYPNIFACGDVTEPFQFTHTAAHQAWYAAVNALFGQLRRFRADYRVIPRCTFTTPELAQVGLTEQQARDAGIACEVTRYDIGDLDRAIADGTARGMVKVLTPPGRDTILGVTIVADHAGESLAEYALAMKHGLGLKKILATVHAYPTMAEAAKFVAGEWSRNHAPSRLLRWLGRYHRWRRGPQAPAAAANGTTGGAPGNLR